MDILRRSVLRAQLAKPLPGQTQSGGSQQSPEARGGDTAVVDARFAALDRKLDALIHMLNAPSEDQQASRFLDPADVRRAVAVYFGVTERAMDRGGRRARIARIRQIAYYLCRTHTRRSLPEIGRIFGRDHTTVLHGVRKIDALRKTDAELGGDLSALEARLADLPARRSAV